MLNVPRCLLSAYKQNIGVDDNFYNLPKIRQTSMHTEDVTSTVLWVENSAEACPEHY